MLGNTNADFLQSISKLLSEGKIDAETAGKLLNTCARFEERVGLVELNNSTSTSQVD